MFQPSSFVILTTLLAMLSACGSFHSQPTVITLGPLQLERSAPIKIGPPLLAKQAQVMEVADTLMLGFIEFNENKKTELFKIGTCTTDLASESCPNFITLFEGTFAFHPRFHRRPVRAEKPEEVWATWCGLKEIPIPDDNKFSYPTTLYIQKIWPSLGAVTELNEPEGYICGQAGAFDESLFHFVYERADKQGMSIFYRTMDVESGLISDEIRLSRSLLSRRPDLKRVGPNLLVAAWDEWVPVRKNRPVAPDYDVYLTWIGPEGPGKRSLVLDENNNDSLAQAPQLFVDGTSVWVAYHKNTDGILKHWGLKKIENGPLHPKVLDLKLATPFRNANPKEENQGAEFPQIWGIKDGSPIFTSRPSHDAFLHFINGDEVETLSLDKDGWGARDLWMSGSYRDSKLTLIRRGHKNLQLEQFSFKGKLPPVNFETSMASQNKNILAPVPHRLSYPNTLMGDVHMHSGYSDATGAPDEIYARAYELGHDFAILTDHDNIVGSRLFPSQYYEILMITDLFDTLPDFTTLQAYEWTTPPLPKGFGHKNVYFKGKAPVPVYSYKFEFETTEKLYDALSSLGRKKAVFTAPHHTAWTGTDWDKADPQIQRHFEIASAHGVFEDKNDNPLKAFTRGDLEGHYARDGIKLGKQFGFLSGSDAHGLLSHHGHARHLDPWAQGLTGVYGARPDRDSLFTALYNLQTWATTGPRGFIRIWTTPNMKKKKFHKLDLHYSVIATKPLKEINLIWNGESAWTKTFADNASAPLKIQGVIPLRSLGKPKQAGLQNVYMRAIQKSEMGIENQVDMLFTSPLGIPQGPN
ncbi:MAG: DUF3604 domain-containing protein [Bdellovibrio sp.]|nr:DUF3604 domain-containing protein [Bdellovibrio sp.]